MMSRAACVALVIANLISCGPSEPSRPPVKVEDLAAAAGSGDIAPEPPAKAVEPAPLPADGMVCFGGGETYVWASDGSKTQAPPTHNRIASDGSLYESIRQGKQLTSRLISRTRPDVPSVEVGLLDEVWIAGSGTVLSKSDQGELKIHRGGSAVVATGIPANEPIMTAVEHDSALWVQTSAKLYRERAAAFEQVPVEVKGADMVEALNGFAQHGASLTTFIGTWTASDHGLYMAPIKDGKVTKPTRIGKLNTMVGRTKALANANGSWAVFTEGGGYATIYAAVAGGKVANLSRTALGLIAIDGYDRVWYRNEAGLVARAPDGVETLYAKASHPMFGLDPLECAVLGKGFAVLPAVGETQRGTLELEVVGAAGAPFAVCGKLLGNRRCENEPDKIAGTLDANGRWSGPVPIGPYQATVQWKGAWMVADIVAPGGGTSKFSCDVKPGESCKISLRAD